MTEPENSASQARSGIAWASFARTWPIAVAVMLGVGLIYGVGFAGSATIHDAAHDTRHSLSFPCH